MDAPWPTTRNIVTLGLAGEMFGIASVEMVREILDMRADLAAAACAEFPARHDRRARQRLSRDRPADQARPAGRAKRRRSTRIIVLDVPMEDRLVASAWSPIACSRSPTRRASDRAHPRGRRHGTPTTSPASAARARNSSSSSISQADGERRDPGRWRDTSRAA